MAEEKTKKVFVRLTRDFPAGVTHRRGGVSFAPGPQPILAEVTKEQLQALEDDRYVEIVDAKEAKKWEERLGLPDAPTSAELADPEVTTTGGRNYEGTDTGSTSTETEEGDTEADDTSEPELSLDMKLVDLQAAATKRGVADADQLRSKQAVLDAIQAHEATSTETEEE